MEKYVHTIARSAYSPSEAHHLGYIADRWGLIAIALMEAANGRCPLATCSNIRQQDGKQPSLLHYQLHYQIKSSASSWQ